MPIKWCKKKLPNLVVCYRVYHYCIWPSASWRDDSTHLVSRLSRPFGFDIKHQMRWKSLWHSYEIPMRFPWIPMKSLWNSHEFLWNSNEILWNPYEMPMASWSPWQLSSPSRSVEAMNLNQLGDFELQLRSLRPGLERPKPGIMVS